ncbi:acyclic terpene utilization AtuA family protein [Sphingomonas jatrophae]|uniref:DUF1446 domain-containing protein n=1 Tax=Sphingomonas jatrophae TaxID=1166337 RepID=A0A1I6KC30_9SPHN|nr:acyclic terpene utilization AtuA family protein [Sphingomonas jatrophae]SFR88771.1 Protein of unknown function [Sphingomonas jatrophae]
MTDTSSARVVHIAGASGALNDSAIAVPQLLKAPKLDYLAFDYLGEAAMGLFRQLKQANPASGFMSHFVEIHIGPYLAELKARNIRVATNAGGMNPAGLAEMIRERARALDLDIKVAVVEGDDIEALAPELRAEGVRDMFSGAAFPDPIGSVNAYLGAFPIAAAFAAGADIVITGRVVDSALILGPLIHEFGWEPDDYDRLAAGTVAGHLLECGAQVTGGTFTDWADVPGWANIGFPIGECHADGSVVITKPAGTGGLVSIGTVAEQLLYEVSDPQAYIVPDVVCDFSAIELEQAGVDRVRVSGARGYPPTASYKVCSTFEDGWRSIALQPIIGIDAPAKARKQADALLERSATMLRERNLGPWRRTHVEVIGTEASYGEDARPLNPREVLLKIVVDHDLEEAVALFGREQTTAIMNMAVGTSIAPIIAAPRAIPLTGMFLFLIDKARVTATVTLDGRSVPVPPAPGSGFDPAMLVRPPAPSVPDDAEAEVPLIRLAWARSGDKGDLFNVGVIARRPEYLPYIRASLTPERVAHRYRHMFADPARARVDVYDAPGFHALNFVVHEAQGGGINLSPRLDPAAKSMAQHLLEETVRVPRALAASLAG